MTSSPEFVPVSSQHAVKLCANLMNWTPSWNQIRCSPIQRGKSNQIFICQLGESSPSSSTLFCQQPKVPTKVIVRFYGSEHTGKGNRYKSLCEENELELLRILHDRGMGPKVHATFDGGRIEEFVESTPMLHRDLITAPMVKILGRKVAQFNSLEHWKLVPDSNVFDAFSNLRAQRDEQLIEIEKKIELISTGSGKAKWLAIKEFTESDVIDSLVNTCRQYFHTKIFAHLDLNYTNFLLIKSTDENNNHVEGLQDIMLIDLENCMLAYRAIELGKFFGELSFEEDIYHSLPCELYEELIQAFCGSYLDEWRKSGKYCDPVFEDFDYVQKEIKLGILFSTVFHIIWNQIHPDFPQDSLLNNTANRINLFKKLANRWPILE
ncbi:choline kinase A2-like [Brevipalpus obovatus]|uniref:choline kinase A2-like n=1 Tax=Brevipalpus obovatus TaxID=246614 RepID=UPI003D9DE5DE